MAYKSQPTVTRPANVTAYTAGDVVGGAFQLTGLPANIPLLLTSGALRVDTNGVPAGMTSFTLELYSQTPPSAIADNAQWDLAAADRDYHLCSIPLGSPADKGSTLKCEADSINKHILSQGTGIFAYLVTNGGFTPAANSEVYVPTLYAMVAE